jgi:hypothetical protein
MQPVLPRRAYQLWLFGKPDSSAKQMASPPEVCEKAHNVSERVNRLRE